MLEYTGRLELGIEGPQNRVFKLTSKRPPIQYNGTEYHSCSEPVFVQLNSDGSVTAEKDVLFRMRESFHTGDEYIYSHYPHLCELFRKQVDGEPAEIRVVKFDKRGTLEKLLTLSNSTHWHSRPTIIRVPVAEVMSALLFRNPQFLLNLTPAEVIRLTDTVIYNRKALGWSAMHMAKQFKTLCLNIRAKSTPVEELQLKFFANVLSKEALLAQFNNGGWWNSQHEVAKSRMLAAATQVGLSSEEIQSALTLQALTKK